LHQNTSKKIAKSEITLMITASDKNFSLRKNLVMFALENGIKPAARNKGLLIPFLI
jgi:hypothetical protein